MTEATPPQPPPPRPLWRELFTVAAVGILISVLLFTVYLGIAILRSAW